MIDSSEPARSARTTLAWAAFLACSWTWSIGMYLPGLLVREFGVWGWVVFAVPNVAGAALMGVVMTRQRSLRFVEKHRWACRAFSVVTIAFHLFWVMWFLKPAGGLTAPLGVVLLAAGWYWLGRHPGIAGGEDADRRSAVVVLALSLMMMAAVFASGLLPRFEAQPSPVAAWIERGLVYLAPLFCFGFFLAPYLDLTFHRVCQQAGDRQRPWAFVLGFGVLFLLMIVFSLGYAAGQFEMIGAAAGDRPPWLLPVLLHMVVQSGFTIAVHARELGRGHAAQPARLWPGLAAAAILAGALPLLAAGGLPRFGLGVGDVAYRLFLAFYGAVFPAYVWLAGLRRRDPARGIGRAGAGLLVAGLAAAAPVLWIGFLSTHRVWLLPALGVLLATGLGRLGGARLQRTSAEPA